MSRAFGLISEALRTPLPGEGWIVAAFIVVVLLARWTS